MNIGNNAPGAPTSYYIYTDSPQSFTQDTTLDITLPVNRVDIHVQDPLGNSIANTYVSTNTVSDSGIVLAGYPAYGYSSSSGYTDASGNLTFWLFSTTSSNKYTFTATPPAGTPFAQFNISDIEVKADKSIVIVLQFVHPSPLTVATFDPPASEHGIYSDPVSVTLSASATPGFSVDATYYSLDGAPEQLYTAPFLISGEGTHTLEFWSIDDAGVYEEPKTETVVIQEQFPDLTFSAAGIGFSNGNPIPSDDVVLDVDVLNQGYFGAENITVRFFDFDTQIGETLVGQLDPGISVNVSITANFPTEGFHLITVQVDPDDAISELSEVNNETSHILEVGQPNLSDATILLQASDTASCQGNVTSISGSAFYDFASIPGNQDHPVQGGRVTLRLMDPTGSMILGVFTGAHTDVNGNFSQSFLAPSMDGTYPIYVEVTDNTITVEIEKSLTVSGPCSEPTPPPSPPPSPSPGGDPPPNTPPTVVQDAYIFSEDILFSDENPDPEETITIFAYVHYYSTEPVYYIPVKINAIYPVGGVLQSFQIGGNTWVSFPSGGAGSPVAIGIPWTNNVPGAQIIQVVLEPDFTQNTKNDAATRLIFVGPVFELDISKAVSLLVDADSNGFYSPGDTLEYTINFENISSENLSGATLIDDFDEALVDSPFQVSDGGTLADGTLTWDLGLISAGSTGSVSYQATIKAQGEFPSGVSTISNIAILATEETAPVAASASVEVIVNRPPTVEAGGPYTVDEGSSVEVVASGSDPDGDSITYQWDLDNDGIFEADGATATFSAANLDGPSTYTIVAKATDGYGLESTNETSVVVENVAPTIETLTAPLDPVQVGATVETSATFTDPGVPDTHTATWDWGDDSTSEGTVDSYNVSGSHVYATPGVYTLTLTVEDDDGGIDTATFQYVVIYDPDGGFVTGSGWIWSPLGAFIPDDTLEGKATFGFVSKYKKGATVPTGNTVFKFHTADMNFQSDTYEWLVVNQGGANAQFKGTGTINGDVDPNGNLYKFMLWAGDDSPDTFRIRIWWEDTDTTEYDVYDNGTDQPIDGGSIVIHK